MGGKRRIGEALPISQRNKLEGMLGERKHEGVADVGALPENRSRALPEKTCGTSGVLAVREMQRYQDILNLSANALLLAVELLCGRDINRIGLFQVKGGFATLSSRLKLELRDVETAFRELEMHGIAAFDPGAEVFLVRDFFRHNPLVEMGMAENAAEDVRTVPENALFLPFSELLEDLSRPQEERDKGIPGSYNLLSRELAKRGLQVRKVTISPTAGTGKVEKPAESLQPRPQASKSSAGDTHAIFLQTVKAIQENRRCFLQAAESLGLTPGNPLFGAAREFTDRSSIALDLEAWKKHLKAYISLGDRLGVNTVRRMTSAFFEEESGAGADLGIAVFLRQTG